MIKSLDFMNYNFILLLIIIAISIYFYFQIKNIKKQLFIISKNHSEFLTINKLKNNTQQPTQHEITQQPTQHEGTQQPTQHEGTLSHTSSDTSSDTRSDTSSDISHENIKDNTTDTEIETIKDNMNEKLDFIMEIPDLINGELTIDKIDNIMSDDEDNKDEDNKEEDNTNKSTDYNIETGETDPNFVYNDDNTLQNKSVSELKKILDEFNLPSTGNKSKLIEKRIIEYKKV